MSGKGDYVCTLKPDTLEKARKELNEDPQQRASQIQALRDWVTSQPHMTSRTDDHFLLRFLRTAKFSQLRAQQMLENFWTVRSVPGKGAPDWFAQLDPRDARVQEVLELGVSVPLPGKDDEGRQVVLVRTGGYDPNVYSLAEIMRIGFLNSDIMLMDEENQVHGFQTVLDFGEFSTSHVWHWNRDAMQKSMKCWQDTYPMRQKGTHFVNTPTIFNALHEITLLFAKEKSKKRMNYHKNNLESLHKAVPKRKLPTHLGGDAGPIEDIARSWKEVVLKNVREFELNQSYGVDETKKPESGKKQDGWGITGAFRRLNVD